MSHQDNYSTLEVDTSAELPQVKPTDNPPQALPKDALPEVAAPSEAKSRSAEAATICGLRKAIFWASVITAALVVIGISVGVGVGVSVTRHRNSNAGNNSITQDNISGRPAPFSRISASNYTDKQGLEHVHVYFQDSCLNIWMADREVRKDEWDLSPVNTTGMAPRKGTPIAAFDSVDRMNTDFHLDFSSSNNKIRNIWAADRGSSAWEIASAPDDTWEITENSGLAAYDTQCYTYCEDQNEACFNCTIITIYVFQSPVRDNQTAVAYPYNNAVYFGTYLPDGVGPDDGTSYALVPIQPIATLGDKEPNVALYLSAQGRLSELFFAKNNRPQWKDSNLNLNMSIPTGSQIAAMSYTQNSLRYGQVILTKEDGGVMMAYLDGFPANDWTSVTSVDGMENVIALSPITATQSGQVYALERDEDRVHIVEFNRTSVTGMLTGMPTFERLGPIKIPESTTPC
ncbi:uncharacterized protein K452DRAFT_313874 [Aplosporella prunicola CBS 121167]|uniref:Fucose-specific lectin n=1 Tax=Aplosporella prunicola CBS 121167 TaxID=1176127 RepID=A0A6A6AVH0_9PEZI|nr:uncharacterized protein K452DRAFT_313874 [Aplosporella prunicola CBS 121167]KAF2135586.1 hypothetical protein K452DRAFT_313874 [Aplosporella prunicola CBS 121167]